MVAHSVLQLHRDDRDVHRVLLGEVLQLHQVDRVHPDRAALLRRDAFQLQPMGADRLHVGRPPVDQRHVLSAARQVAAHLAADSARADRRDPGSHPFPPIGFPRY